MTPKCLDLRRSNPKPVSDFVSFLEQSSPSSPRPERLKRWRWILGVDSWLPAFMKLPMVQGTLWQWRRRQDGWPTRRLTSTHVANPCRFSQTSGMQLVATHFCQVPLANASLPNLMLILIVKIQRITATNNFTLTNTPQPRTSFQYDPHWKSAGSQIWLFQSQQWLFIFSR